MTETVPQAIAHHIGTGEKFANEEVTGELAAYALVWLSTYEGSFEYLIEMKDTVERKGSLSVGQTRGVLNCVLAEAKKAAKKNAVTVDVVIPDVPAGRYALPNADNTHLVFWKVDRPTEGKWEGYVFVKQLIGSVGDWQESRVSKSVRESVLARIAEVGATTAAQAYGQATQSCGYCGSPLSNPQSRAAGYGETCANNHGYFYPTLEEAVAILDEMGQVDGDLPTTGAILAKFESQGALFPDE